MWGFRICTSQVRHPPENSGISSFSHAKKHPLGKSADRTRRQDIIKDLIFTARLVTPRPEFSNCRGPLGPGPGAEALDGGGAARSGACTCRAPCQRGRRCGGRRILQTAAAPPPWWRPQAEIRILEGEPRKNLRGRRAQPEPRPGREHCTKCALWCGGLNAPIVPWVQPEGAERLPTRRARP